MSTPDNKLLLCKHPNSRKTKALSKQIKKQSARQKSKLGTIIKQNLLAEKIFWFQSNSDSNKRVYTRSELNDLIESYLNRFNKELEQIVLKNSIGQRKNRQHASREDIIKMTMKREVNEFTTCGIEVPNLLEPSEVEQLRNWNGEVKFLQNFTLKRITKQSLIS